MRAVGWLVDSIARALAEHGEMSVSEISKAIAAYGKLRAKRPEASIATCLCRNPEKFMRVRQGVYGLKKPQASHRQRSAQDKKHDTEYSYWENLARFENGTGIYGGVDDQTHFVFTEKNKKIFEEAIERLNLEPVAPGVYVLVNAKDNVVYVGETKDLKKRIKDQHWTNKKFTHILAINDPAFNNINLRKKLEEQLIKFSESIGWRPSNTTNEKTTLDKKDIGRYSRLVERADLVVVKMREGMQTSRLGKPHTGPRDNPPRPPIKRPWASSLAGASPQTQSVIRRMIRLLDERFTATKLETSWLYFCEGAGVRKRAFVALDVGKTVAYLVFLAPRGALLPNEAKRVTKFVLTHDAECRLRLSDSNLSLAAEWAARSLQHKRMLDGQQGHKPA